MDDSQPGLDSVAVEFMALRPNLLRIARRVVGSYAEAEDVVQDVWLRWQAYNRDTVRTPIGFLATTTARLALNVVLSARVRWDSPSGLPAMERPSNLLGPSARVEAEDAIRLALVRLLERLSPAERAAFVLRECFDYDYGEIASIVDATETRVRKLVSRARAHLAGTRRAPVSRREYEKLVEAFMLASRRGELAPLERLLVTSLGTAEDPVATARAA